MKQKKYVSVDFGVPGHQTSMTSNHVKLKKVLNSGVPEKLSEIMGFPAGNSIVKLP